MNHDPKNEALVQSEHAAKVQSVEERRLHRREQLRQQRDAQYARDLEALDAAELEHGASRVTQIELPFVPGLPTMVIVRAPKAVEYKRYRDMTRNATQGFGVNGQKTGNAADLLADVCVIYPEAKIYAEVKEAVPGVHDNAFQAAHQLAEGKAVQEGKV